MPVRVGPGNDHGQGIEHQLQFPAGLRAVDWPPGFDFSVLERELIPVVTPGFIWLIFIL
jgi:hypothetical protein